jgi:hypothetical protein
MLPTKIRPQLQSRPLARANTRLQAYAFLTAKGSLLIHELDHLVPRKFLSTHTACLTPKHTEHTRRPHLPLGVSKRIHINLRKQRVVTSDKYVSYAGAKRTLGTRNLLAHVLPSYVLDATDN